MAYTTKQTYSEEDKRAFRRKDKEMLLSVIFKGLCAVKEGTNIPPTKEEVEEWFNFIKEKAEPEMEEDGIWFGGSWYPLKPDEAKNALQSIKPF